MSFEEWSNEKKKKKPSSFEEWSNATRGVTKEQEEEDERKRQAYIASRHNDDDIAPVKKESEERTWFKKSEGNWWQTLLGSRTDVQEHVTSGFLSVGEKITDAFAVLGNAMVEGQMMQSAQDQMLTNAILGKKDEDGEKVIDRTLGVIEDVRKGTSEFVAKDLYDEEAIAKAIISDPMRKIGIDSEAHSVFGEKSDALAMSGGQLGAQIVADVMLPGSGVAVSALSAFGSEAESALQNGATFDEALLTSTISATAEVLTEKIGGVKFGGKTLTDAAFGALSGKVTGKFAKFLISTGKIGADASAEAFEEVISGYVSAFGQQLTYMDDKEIEELFTKEDLLEAAIGGLVLGGGFSVGEAAISGRNPVSGLNKNEQAVVDKVVEGEISAKEADGKTLTDKEKAKIRETVAEKLEKGQIDIDTIDSMFGGEEYKAYKDTVTREDALRAEYEGLGALEKPTLAQQTRYKELHESRDTFVNDDMRNDLRKKLDDKLAPIIKDSKLAESYREDARSRQKFKADPTQYKDENARKTIQNLMDSELMNDTRDTHEFADWIAQIAADKGVTVRMTNDEALKGTRYEYKGTTTNAYFNEETGEVTLNISSKRPLNSSVGHELGHVLKGIDENLYEEFKADFKEWANNKNGEWDARYKITAEAYAKRDADGNIIRDADGNIVFINNSVNVEDEVLNDLIGDYIFTDKDFIKHLSAKQPNVFKRFWDEIKYMVKVAKAGTKVEKELLAIEKRFAEIWRETGKYQPKTAEATQQAQNSVQDADAIAPNAEVDVAEETVAASEDVKVLEGGTAVKYSLSTWTPETQDKVRKNLAKAGYEAERVDKWIDDLNSVASVIAADKDRLDFEAADNQVMLKNNQEYVKTLDASTLCAKRLKYQGTFNAIQHRLPNTVLTSDDLIELQNMMKEHGHEAPCSVCYVESRRRHLGKFAQEWLDGYEGEYKPRLDEVTTSDGLETLRHSHPQTYQDFVDAMNAKGSANPKVVQLRTAYRNDIMALTKKQVEKIEAIGGLRIQSFSDFETPHLLDMMQAVMDMSAKGLTSQAYTKVPNFAWVFGDTGIKINLSLIAEGNGFDSEGNLAFSSVEGMDINEAMAVRDAYPANVGTIIVGANDAHILACMADDRIDYIIPFHRSGWGKNEMDMMGLGSYEDYSYGQNEHDLETGKKVANLYPPDYWDYSVSGKENAERYLKLCAQTGREPKFSQFLVNNGDGSYSLQPDGSTDGYWKTLIDFKMYDNEGNGVKQQKVQPNFNMEEAYRVLNEYEGGANSLPVANDVVEEFVAKHSDDIAPTPDVQFSLSPETDAEYMSAVERGDTETAQRMVDEAAKKAGYTRTLYHGTASKFNVFGFGRTGIFTTDNYDMAKTYGDNVISLYGKEGANVLTIDAQESPHYAIKVSKDVLDFSEYPLMRGKETYSTNDISLIAFREGYDVVVIKNVYDNYSAASGNTENGLGTDVVYKDSNQVKSSEAVTYDDNGNVIPLSERFNTANEDIRYSASNEGESFAPYGDFAVYGKDIAYTPLGEDIAPIGEGVTPVQTSPDTVGTSEAPALENIPVLPDEELADGTYEVIKPGEEKPAVSKSVGNTADGSATEAPKPVLDKPYYVSNKALSLYNEVKGMRKGVRVSEELSRLLDNLDLSEENKADSYNQLRTALMNIKNSPDQTVNENSDIESIARELINDAYDSAVYGVDDLVAIKLKAVQDNIAENKANRRAAEENYASQIAKLQAEYDAKKNKNTQVANGILQSISRLKRLQKSTDAKYAKTIHTLEARAEKMQDPKYSRAKRRQAKMKEHAQWAADLLGNTFTWKDKKLGLQYATNTERRNLRDIVRDENGNVDIARADAINDALNGQYNREEASKQRELAQARDKFAKMKITTAEDAYIQMLGELRHNPHTELTEAEVSEYYEAHKNKIDTAKVEKIIELARQDYDDWFSRVNAALREQGMREIPYHQGYFPHLNDPKQNFIQRLLNWKTQDNEIPTSIAGLTETFRPSKSWQSFDKKRRGEKTDYSFMKGYDTYSDGVLDWIYHLDTLQKRRAVENHIRFTHSDEGVQARIKEVYANEEMDANEAQAQIQHILSEANNPLNNFVQDFTTHTNILAGKKNSLDRTLEQWTNRHIYSVMTNVQNRMSANMVLANVRSAMTNFIPITQSWAQVSPLRSVQAAKETIANAIKDDGTIDKSTFLTNRLREADKLYQTNWDKVLDKAGIMFEIVDSFSSQVIWRSKYNQNLANGMSESEAIKNADQFAENVMAGRSKGNEPTLFNAKNPFVKAFTMFQLEVNNQYGYLFKDVPNDLKAETNHWKLNLVKGYTTAFIGAYVYNALLETVTGSDAALDPIGIIEDLLRDLGLFDDDEEKEPTEVATNLIGNVAEELPFVGGVLGGGRIPISSAIPYGGEYGGGVSGFIEDVGNIGDGGLKNIGKEMMNPLLNVGLPVAGGQLKKTYQGLNMFSDEHPVSGSYTDSGNLRFPVEATPLNVAQAAIFGQYASKNAREYFDNDYAPLAEKQIEEYIDVDMPIKDYWDYRKGLKGLKTNEEKIDYISGLDLPTYKKNILANNVLDRKTDVDLENYDDFGSLEEFDYATKNPEKYALAKTVGGYSAYKTYSGDLYDIKADKDENGKSINGSRKEKVLDYINNLDADYHTKIILYKSEYPSDDTYNSEIVNYINNRSDLSYDERVAILTELGFRVTADGQIYDD